MPMLNLTLGQEVGHFLTRFNCAGRQLQKAGRTIGYQQPYHKQIQGLCFHPIIERWELKSHGSVHPLALFVVDSHIDGNHKSAVDIVSSYYRQLDFNAFAQGFDDLPHYKDIWTGPLYAKREPSYYQSILFNMGRYYLHKYCGIKLPYCLPPADFLQLFNKLL